MGYNAFSSLLPASFWAAPNGNTNLWLGIALALVLGFAAVFGLTFLPPSARRWVVTGATFLGGLYYVLLWLWPKPYYYEKTQIPSGWSESVGAWLEKALPTFSSLENTVAACLLGLGIYSLLRIHLTRLFKFRQDWAFSLVLVVSLVAMLVAGYLDWHTTFLLNAKEFQTNPQFVNYANDFLFDGMFVNMDACMFSIISFFIFSAAYRAFRIRSVESTILLVTALIIMLSLMGAITVGWDSIVDKIGHGGLLENLRLGVIKGWVQDTLQSPSIRAMEFGLAIGGLAISLRLWLSMEKGVSH